MLPNGQYTETTFKVGPCNCALTTSISTTSFTYNVNDPTSSDFLHLFTASGAECGTVTHALSHSPNTAGIFSTSGNGYSWYTNDSSLAGTYTVTVTATEDGCSETLTDTYTITVACPCTLTSIIDKSVWPSLNYYYNVNAATVIDNISLFTASGASCGTVSHSHTHSPNTASIFS